MMGDWRLGAILLFGTTSSAVPSVNLTVSSTDYGASIVYREAMGCDAILARWLRASDSLRSPE